MWYRSVHVVVLKTNTDGLLLALCMHQPLNDPCKDSRLMTCTPSPPWGMTSYTLLKSMKRHWPSMSIECAVSLYLNKTSHFHAYAIYTDSLKHKPITDSSWLAFRQPWVQSMHWPRHHGIKTIKMEDFCCWEFLNSWESFCNLIGFQPCDMRRYQWLHFMKFGCYSLKCYGSRTLYLKSCNFCAKRFTLSLRE